MNDNQTGRWVYLVGAQQARPVKIGVAKSVETRIAELQIGSPLPLQLIWKTRGGRTLERALHERFAQYRIHGEWFDFGHENPAAVVASAAVSLGYVTHAERGQHPSSAEAPRTGFITGRKTLINHLIDAADSTGRGNVTKREVFAYMASVDQRFERTEGETDKHYWSRAGMLLSKAMVKEMLDVKVAQISLAEGQPRIRGYRLSHLQETLAELLERHPIQDIGRRG